MRPRFIHTSFTIQAPFKIQAPLKIKSPSKIQTTLKTIVQRCVLSIAVVCSPATLAKEIHVAKTGNDAAIGSLTAPLLTLSKAAKTATAGDTVIVHEGIYRESVTPMRSGRSNTQRIVYQAAEGEQVVISGSEPIHDWEKVEDSDLWTVIIPKSLFGDYNPFAKLVRHDDYVDADESSQGWGWLNYGRRKHRGDVYFNGQGFTEKEHLDALTEFGHWYADVSPNEKFTTLWAHFGQHNPNEHTVEVNVRPTLFFPEKNNVSYITVKGFTLQHAATSWMPPTVEQIGAIGPNGGHHWIIEDNNIVYSKGVCVSLGLPTGKASHADSGHHIIRNNIIARCGQAGVAGESWASHTSVTHNVIEDINYRRQLGGHETAAIKFHRANDVTIAHNLIRGVYTKDVGNKGSAHGIWVDFKNTHWRIANNVIMDTDKSAILFEANWQGPFAAYNNVIINGTLQTMSSKNQLWTHNLFLNTGSNWLNQTYGGRPEITGSRWLNNLFIGGVGIPDLPKEAAQQVDYNLYLNGAQKSAKDPHSLVDAYDPNVRYSVNSTGVTLSFDWQPRLTIPNTPKITADYVHLPLQHSGGNHLNITTDFFHRSWPQSQPIAGPFSDLKKGRNHFTLYTFPDRYETVKGMM